MDVPEGLDVDDELFGEQSSAVPRAACMLVLSAASKNLMESDFLRLGVKGRHVEGWVSGILKGITFPSLSLSKLIFPCIHIYSAPTDRIICLHPPPPVSQNIQTNNQTPLT